MMLTLYFSIAPGHEEVKGIPQNVAWLSAIKNAQKSIFMSVFRFLLLYDISYRRVYFFSQSPTFNASPVIPAVLDACRRDIECTLYLDLGKRVAIWPDLLLTLPRQASTISAR